MRYRKIKLSQNKWTLVDVEDFELLSLWRWQNWKRPNDRTSYARCKIWGLLHRFILQVEKGQIIDHINGNGLDNRKQNLRIVSASENQWNMSSRKNRNLPKGVYLSKSKKRKKRFYIQLQKHGVTYSKGMFATKEEASRAYQKFATRFHGNFAQWTR